MVFFQLDHAKNFNPSMDWLETLNLLRLQWEKKKKKVALESRRPYSANPDGKSMKVGLIGALQCTVCRYSAELIRGLL